MKSSRVYLINGLSLLAAWALGRILFFMLFFVHVYEHQHQLPRIALVIRVLLLGIPVLLFMLNLLWFVKILRGARKLLFPKNRDEKVWWFGGVSVDGSTDLSMPVLSAG